jgi:NlpC/P60 family putative phage cell wall peptidase
MEIEKLPPPCGEAEACSASGGGRCLRQATVPRPTQFASLIVPSSPQGVGQEVIFIARSWIGTPYIHQASVKGAGCDCLGLLRGVWRELRGQEPEPVPPYTPDWDVRGETLRDALRRHLDEIAPGEIAPGDVVLFRMVPRGSARHCAVVAEKDGRLTLIHARQNRRVSEESFTAFWRKKLAHAFRL